MVSTNNKGYKENYKKLIDKQMNKIQEVKIEKYKKEDFTKGNFNKEKKPYVKLENKEDLNKEKKLDKYNKENPNKAKFIKEDSNKEKKPYVVWENKENSNKEKFIKSAPIKKPYVKLENKEDPNKEKKPYVKWENKEAYKKKDYNKEKFSKSEVVKKPYVKWENKEDPNKGNFNKEKFIKSEPIKKPYVKWENKEDPNKEKKLEKYNKEAYKKKDYNKEKFSKSEPVKKPYVKLENKEDLNKEKFGKFEPVKKSYVKWKNKEDFTKGNFNKEKKPYVKWENKEAYKKKDYNKAKFIKEDSNKEKKLEKYNKENPSKGKFIKSKFVKKPYVKWKKKKYRWLTKEFFLKRKNAFFAPKPRKYVVLNRLIASEKARKKKFNAKFSVVKSAPIKKPTITRRIITNIKGKGKAPVKKPVNLTARKVSVLMSFKQIERKFIGHLTRRGLRSKALKIWLKFLIFLKRHFYNSPVRYDLKTIVLTVIKMIKPVVILKHRKIAGTMYQIPYFVQNVTRDNGTLIAIRWLVQASEERLEHDPAERLYKEFLDVLRNQGICYKKKQDIYSSALKNRIYVRYLFPKSRRRRKV